MKFFLDTADVDEIRQWSQTGLLDGVTTNPSLVAKTGRDFIEVLQEICAIVPGPVSAEVTATDADTMIAEGRKLRELAGTIARRLAVLADVLDGDLERVQRVVRLGVFVASAPSFTDQPRVANGASELLQKVLGENGRHARAAVGAVSLPMGAPVEVEMTVAVAAG